MMDFVWVYIHEPSDYAKTGRFYELDYSIRSVRQNYLGNCRLFVVGDDPQLEGVIYLPCERITSSPRGYVRHFDQVKKLKEVLKHVSDEFVLMYDDIYILQPTIKRELKKFYAKGMIDDIEEYIGQIKGSNPYKKTWLNTYTRIQEFRDDLWEWETHLPRYFESAKLDYIIDKYNLERVAYLLYSLYAAEFCETPELVTDEVQQEVIEYAPHHTDWEKTFSARHLNLYDDGLSQEFINEMKKRFGD